MIDVDSVVVDREFVAKHPNVRPGEHVLLTVNEQRRATPAESAGVSTFTGDSPGVDLGALQALVSECGGHLWMRAEPPGDMELKIHLPRRVLDRSETPAPAISSGRSRWLKRAFGARHWSLAERGRSHHDFRIPRPARRRTSGLSEARSGRSSQISPKRSLKSVPFNNLGWVR
jgi:hypothetical protein